jgi:hypothetical protein
MFVNEYVTLSYDWDADWAITLFAPHLGEKFDVYNYNLKQVRRRVPIYDIVGAVVTPEAREYTEQNGFFVLELTGQDIRLLEPPENFVPKEW